MGELDEAIRAHLELKRRHGASDAELHAEEQEALGPVRRDAAGGPALEDDGFADEPVPEGEAYAFDDPEDEGAVLGHLPDEGVEPGLLDGAEEAVDLGGEGAALPGDDAGPVYEFEPPPGHEGLEPDPYDDPPAEPPPPVPAEAPADDPLAGDTPARGFAAVEEPLPPAGTEPTEDVLEETPDFLQETPEHDRLWFEQKPPRDFDFDDE